MTRRLLAVSWEMPPMYGPRGTQVAATVRELAALGWRPSIVCLAPRRGGPHWPDGIEAAAIPGVNLIRVPSLEESFAWRAAARLLPVIRRFPDEKRLWVGAASAAALRAAATQSFDRLITFAQPWSDHLVGLKLRAKLLIPWVAHFSDPWVDSPYARGPQWQRRIWHQMEREVITAADAVVFVSDETADVVMRKYPDAWRSKVSIVPHGFEPDRAIAAGAVNRATRPMRMLYTGRFYRGVRTPLSFLRALASMNRRRPLVGSVEVRFMGPHVEEFKRHADSLGLSAIVTFEGRRSRADAGRAARDSDVLLVIDAPSEGPSVFLPSKLIEYLAYRKPILGLTPPRGATARLLERLDCPVASPDDETAIETAVSHLIERFLGGTVDVSPAFDLVRAEYDIRRTTSRLDAVLSAACARAA